MAWVRIALALTKLATALIKEVERRRLLNEGEKRQLAKQQEAFNDAVTKALRAADAVNDDADSVRNDPRNRD